MRTKNTLLVSTDKRLCQGVIYILQDEGHSIKCTDNKLSAEKFIDDDSFDIAIFDYRIPGINGIDLSKKIKNKDPNTKVFIMTGHSLIEEFLDEQKASMMVDGIIRKPFSDTMLLEKIGY
ncbi:MAG: response regulator [bacterium]